MLLFVSMSLSSCISPDSPVNDKSSSEPSRAANIQTSMPVPSSVPTAITTIADPEFKSNDKSKNAHEKTARSTFMEKAVPLREDELNVTLIEEASSKIKVDENGLLIRPFFAYDKNRLIMVKLDQRTGYREEFLIYENGQPELKTMLVRGKEYKEITPAHSPDKEKEDVRKNIYHFILYDDTFNPIYYRYDLKTGMMDPDKEESIKSEEEALQNNMRFRLEEDPEDEAYPWVIKEGDKTLFHVSRADIMLKEGDQLLLLQLIYDKHYIWDGEKLYQIPAEIAGQKVLHADLTPDDTIFVYLGDSLTIGTNPRYGSEKIVTISLKN